ncbi:MAG TPA: tetratricopeptide repeat protein [Blastocatellia bacterium]|nr:tetratricopeptide repeat protein [Blastocatellia bacterium]
MMSIRGDQRGNQGTKGRQRHAFAFLVLLAFLVSFSFVILEGQAGAQAAKRRVASVEAELKEAVRRSPESFEANHRLGEFYIERQNLAAAIPYLEQAQRIDPAHEANGYDLALAYFKLGDLARARAQIRSRIEIKETAELHSLLGDVEDGAGNLAAAAEAYQRAARMEETENRLLDLGNSLIKINAFEAAVRIFNYGLEKFPRSASLRVGMGIACYSRGQYHDAVKLLCQAVDLEPSDPRPYLFLGEMVGISTEMADEITRRMAEFVKRHPKRPEAYYYYAVSLKRDDGSPGDPARVESLLKTAIALDPKLARAHFELGVVYSGTQRYAEAIGEMQAAIKLQPNLEKAHYRLAQLYRRTGQRELAAREMEVFNRLKERPKGQ